MEQAKKKSLRPIQMYTEKKPMDTFSSADTLNF